MKSDRLRRWLRALCLLVFAASSPTKEALAQSDRAVLVAAASDLQFALPEIAEAFQSETGLPIRLSFGSSGNFARQIRQSAPFEVFFSADEAYVQLLAADGLLRGEGELYGVGRIALIVPHGAPFEADGKFAGLEAAARDGRLKKLAIANPEHAPYGRAAEEALRFAGLWELVKDKLVLGENVSQAALFATSGNAQGGIIAYSLALSPKVAVRGRYALIPAEWHRPLRQRAALTRKASPAAEQFFAFAGKPAARAIFRKYGFLLPGEAS